MTVLFLRSPFSSTFRKKLFAYFFEKIFDNYVINHINFYSYELAKHLSPNKQLMVTS